MKLFLDTAVIDEIRTVHSWGVLDGVTTNPTLFAKAGGGTYPEVLEEICGITSGPVSAEVIADDLEGMLREGREFAKIAPNIIVKVPMTEVGLTAISTFAEEGIKTNCTLIFSSAQGLLAAKAGATYLSPFVGRLDDIAEDGMDMVRELAAILEDPWPGLGDHRGLHALPPPRHRRSARRSRRGHRPVQGVPADGQAPPDGQGHRLVQGRLGQGPAGAGRQGRDGRLCSEEPRGSACARDPGMPAAQPCPRWSPLNG